MSVFVNFMWNFDAHCFRPVDLHFYSSIWPKFTFLILNVPRGEGVQYSLKKQQLFLLLPYVHYDDCSCEYIVRYTNPNKFIKKNRIRNSLNNIRNIIGFWLLKQKCTMQNSISQGPIHWRPSLPHSFFIIFFTRAYY